MKFPNGDGLVHMERPRHHLTLCDSLQETRTWDLAKRPLTCLACIALVPEFYRL